MAQPQSKILDAAKSDNAAVFYLFVILTVICGGIVALNWTYVYNFVTGPYPLTKSVASAPGMREFVRVEGDMFETGAQEYSKTYFTGRGALGRLAAAAGNATSKEHVSAKLDLMALDGGVLLVKVPPDFSGRIVEGRLTSIPEDLKKNLRPGKAVIYPYMLDGTAGYRWDFNLFILVAGPAFPFVLVGLVFAVRKKGNVMRHPALVKLARHGPPMALIPRIEREMAAAGEPAQSLPLCITPNWIVGLKPTLNIFAIRDLCAIGHEVTAKKEKDKITVSHKLHVWTRGDVVAEKIDVKEEEASAILDTLRAQQPWAVIEDVAAFRKQWFDDKDACAREADARRKAAAATPAAPGASDAQPPKHVPA